MSFRCVIQMFMILGTFAAVQSEIFCSDGPCSSGEYLSNTICIPCPEEYYMPKGNQSCRECIRCSTPLDRTFKIQNCTSIKDAVFKCIDPQADLIGPPEYRFCQRRSPSKENTSPTPDKDGVTEGKLKPDSNEAPSSNLSVIGLHNRTTQVDRLDNISTVTVLTNESDKNDTKSGDKGDGNNSNLSAIIIPAVVVSLVIIAIAAIVFCCKRKNRQNKRLIRNEQGCYKKQTDTFLNKSQKEDA